MRTIVSNIQSTIAAACVVALAGCDGEIRPPKNLPAGSAPAAQPPAGSAPTGASPTAVSAPANGSNASGNARAIGTLSTRELIDVCHVSHENLKRALAAQVHIECTASGLSQGSGCDAAREKCVETSEADQAKDEVDCEMEAAQLAQDCATVSIATLRGCEAAWIRKLESTADQLDCGSSLDRIRQMSGREMPAECQNLDARCSNQGM